MFFQKSALLLIIYIFIFLKKLESSNTFDRCLLCNHIIELAESHFHKSEPKDFVLKELETECLYVGEICGGRPAVMYCINQVKENINLIYDDFEKKMRPQEICYQIGDLRSQKDFMEKIYSYKDDIEFDNLLNENGSRIYTDPKCYLSVIIPAMNEQDRIHIMLKECTEYLSKRSINDSKFSYEIIVVDDGSKDNTSEIAYKFSNFNLKIIKLPQNKGKGGAIRDGILHCQGKLILFADADGATKFRDFEKLEKKFREMSNSDNDIDYTFPGIVIGSRCHLEKESIAERSLFRTILMKGFHFIVYLLTVKSVHDTQCGFKIFSRAAAAKLFPLIHIERWAFDVELLYLAEKLYYPINEVAVEWKEVDGSKIVPVWSWLQMGRDIMLIWFHYLTDNMTEISELRRRRKLSSDSLGKRKQEFFSSNKECDRPDKPIHKPQDSLFSSSSGWTNYRGFLNLIILLLVISNGRVALENLMKYDANPLFSNLALSIIVVQFLKLWSYVQVNYWCRNQENVTSLNRKNSSDSNDSGNCSIQSKNVYPENLTFYDIYYFMVAPTLCYELNFPRTPGRRKTFLIKRIIEMIFLPILYTALCQQWIVPLVKNGVVPFSEMNISKMTERVLKLAIPNLLLWLLMFYTIFHSFLNLIAEILRFADREFYRDFWNAESIGMFWRTWNIPVHRWCVRHCFIPLVELGYTKYVASIAVFVVSAFFHEYLVSIPLKMFRLWAFNGMLAQIPLNMFCDKFVKKGKLGNIIVWLSLILGQPMAILMYVHDWYMINYPPV
ncbi:Diacylglycerol O-acyltransferase 1 [Strongyloides ratti]|uniref:diacylglycerol O-acyltransferase n=1 Tax=Strongyloides ratti TaxID=34506 RepID=A0A090KZG9_STRRB|nr:Diacylglycerol O-acyltransferase 1 [Strongyloides ratti]CEF62930.1 Diacylglycerol O-acyltransferase 1 [Strongyloides ratti]